MPHNTLSLSHRTFHAHTSTNKFIFLYPLPPPPPHHDHHHHDHRYHHHHRLTSASSPSLLTTFSSPESLSSLAPDSRSAAPAFLPSKSADSVAAASCVLSVTTSAHRALAFSSATSLPSTREASDRERGRRRSSSPETRCSCGGDGWSWCGD